MFLVEMSYNTIKDKITELKQKTKRKSEALKESTKTLEKDNDKLVKFIAQDNQETQTQTQKADEAIANRKQKEANIKKQEHKIQNLASEIEKNIDALSALDNHKKFLFGIFQQKNREWADNILRIQQEKRDKIKKEWIYEKRQQKGSIIEEDYSQYLAKDKEDG